VLGEEVCCRCTESYAKREKEKGSRKGREGHDGSTDSEQIDREIS
jgi:hypothetical protein